MRRYRRKYYDLFSHFYDWVIRLHSKDSRLALRHYLAKKVGVKPNHRVLDLCTGTGSVAIVLSEYVQKGLVVGADFSYGMLQKAKQKSVRAGLKNVCWVVADAGCLPFKTECFDAITCSHAMYELTGKTRQAALQEIRRCLKKNARFCMMEHEEPKNPFIRLLYHIRLLSMGKEGRQIVRHELEEFSRLLRNVSKEVIHGKTKVICGSK